jgi:RimJ/RimL family protein N-acetyltransferase
MQILSTDDLGEVVRQLERDPLRNIVLLKHIEAFPQHVSAIQVRAETNVATLVLLDTSASAYDRETYPGAAFVALISSGDASLTRRLVKSVPDQCRVVFKLDSDTDREVVADRFPLHRATSFLSFTTDATSSLAHDEKVPVSTSPPDEALGLFETQGHSRAWLRPLLGSDRAFACVLEEAGETRSACIVFENYRRIWEVGGVMTPPRHRGRGLASRVVRSALAELQRRSLVPRYQVNEDNVPSIRLARSVGLQPFLQLTHFRTW